MKMRIATALAALAVAPLVGCGVLGGSVQEFTVGECVLFDAPSGTEAVEVGTLPVVDCSESHDGEVYAVADSTASDFNLATIEDEVATLCFEEFEKYVGISFEESALNASFLYPSADTWASGDRALVCVLTALDGSQSTGSYAGSGI